MVGAGGFDVLVVGAGSAGAVVAARLSEDPACNVGLVEAGPDYPDFELLPAELKYGHASAADLSTAGHLWEYVARPTAGGATAPLPRGRVTGGTSAINGQIFTWGLPEDFAAWVEAGNDRWSFDEVAPVYRSIEDDLDFRHAGHGTSGPIRVRRYPRDTWLEPQAAFYAACLDTGHADAPDTNDPSSTGVGPVPFNNVDGIRASTALAYLSPARRRRNLTVLPDTFARRVVVRDGRAAGVEIVHDGAVSVVEAGEIVLSAGAVGSPHLLLLSGIGPAGAVSRAGVTVEVDLPGVGENLRDHQVVDLWWRRSADAELPAPGSPVVQVALRYTSSGSRLRNDMKITVRNRLTVPGLAAAADPTLVSIVPGLDLAVGSGTLRLVSSDPEAQPEIELRFLDEEADRRRLREGVRLSLELAAHPSFAALVAERISPTPAEEASDEVLDAWIRANVRTSHHLCGTCKMGPASDPTAVVDQYGRVHAVDRLRVADASICPDVPRANLNATAIMVGERIAAFMRAEATATSSPAKELMR